MHVYYLSSSEKDKRFLQLVVVEVSELNVVPSECTLILRGCNDVLMNDRVAGLLVCDMKAWSASSSGEARSVREQASN